MPQLSIGGLALSNLKCHRFWIRKICCHPKAFYKGKLNDPSLSTILALISLLPNKLKGLHFSTAYLSETAFSAFVTIKTKARTRLGVHQDFRLAVTSITPDSPFRPKVAISFLRKEKVTDCNLLFVIVIPI